MSESRKKASRADGPHVPPDYEDPDVFAMKALLAGTAEAHQQQRALKWIIEQAAGLYEQHYYPKSDRDTTFSLGRAFVGSQIVKLLNLSTTNLRRV